MSINRMKALRSPIRTTQEFFCLFVCFLGNVLMDRALSSNNIFLTIPETSVSWNTIWETLVYVAIHSRSQIHAFPCPTHNLHLDEHLTVYKVLLVNIISLHSESLKWLLLALLYR